MQIIRPKLKIVQRISVEMMKGEVEVTRMRRRITDGPGGIQNRGKKNFFLSKVIKSFKICRRST